jgi:hypothetical protein
MIVELGADKPAVVAGGRKTGNNLDCSAEIGDFALIASKTFNPIIIKIS